MRTLLTLIFVALTGCTNTDASVPKEPVDTETPQKHADMPTSIPGQPEKTTVPSIRSSGGGGDPCMGDPEELPVEWFFGIIDDLVMGEIESVSIVLDDVLDSTTGQRITFAECQNVGWFPIVVRVVLKDATSLFQGDIGTIEFLIPTDAIYQMNSYPSFYHEGRWYPQDETPARIDGTVGWSQANSSLQAGQIVMVPLAKTHYGSPSALHSWLHPIFQEVDGKFRGRGMRFDCDLGPSLLSQTFEWEDLVYAYETVGATPSRVYDWEVTLTSFCNEPPPSPPPVIESDAGM